ncbi:MAG: hypothetical protein IJZ23_06845 [Roseburia sp.]|nr:hypothetical protein [Roseburia sp.]MBQ8279542.1 hypothetical protein [Roseburia sp.]
MAYERTIYENDTKVNAAEVLNKLDQGIYDLFLAIAGEKVWVNEDTTASFASTTASVNTDKVVTGFEVLFQTSTTDKSILSTGKVPVGATYCEHSAGHNYYRPVSVSQDGETVTIDIGECTRKTISASPAGSTQNGYVIPVTIKFFYE